MTTWGTELEREVERLQHATVSAVLERELRNRVGSLDGQGPVQIRARPHWGDESNPLGWEVETDQADLLLMGTLQPHGLHRLATGSDALSALHASTVPLPTKECRPRRCDRSSPEPT